MLLAIDIGNSSILMGIFKGDKITASFRFLTDKRLKSAEYEKVIIKQFADKKIKAVYWPWKYNQAGLKQ